MSRVIQVPSCPGRGVSLHARMTASKAVSSVTRNADFRSVFRRLRPTRSDVGSSTHRGSGENQRIGWPRCTKEDPVRVGQQESLRAQITADTQEPPVLRLGGIGKDDIFFRDAVHSHEPSLSCSPRTSLFHVEHSRRGPHS